MRTCKFQFANWIKVEFFSFFTAQIEWNTGRMKRNTFLQWSKNPKKLKLNLHAYFISVNRNNIYIHTQSLREIPSSHPFHKFPFHLFFFFFISKYFTFLAHNSFACVAVDRSESDIRVMTNCSVDCNYYYYYFGCTQMQMEQFSAIFSLLFIAVQRCCVRYSQTCLVLLHTKTHNRFGSKNFCVYLRWFYSVSFIYLGKQFKMYNRYQKLFGLISSKR